jgi:PadR family transcriptional regulator PadR
MLPKLEEMILLAVLKYGPDVRASAVRMVLSNVTRREHTFGSIYTTLDRLVDKKFVRKKKGDPEDRRGGRAPLLYTITDSGLAAVVSSLRITHELGGWVVSWKS